MEMDGADVLRELLNRHLSRNKRRAQTAIALPSAKVLWETCESVMPASILDMGSGFSSVVFRAWALHSWDRALKHDSGACCPRVVSTDHSPVFLDVTRKEVAAEGMDECRGELVLHEEFQARQAAQSVDGTPDKFGLIFLDLSDSAMRLRVLPETIKWLAAAGIIVLDDWHFDHYRPRAQAILEEAGLNPIVLESSRDQFGRHMAIAVNK